MSYLSVSRAVYPEPISIDSSKSLSMHGINSIVLKGKNIKKKMKAIPDDWQKKKIKIKLVKH